MLELGSFLACFLFAPTLSCQPPGPSPLTRSSSEVRSDPSPGSTSSPPLQPLHLSKRPSPQPLWYLDLLPPPSLPAPLSLSPSPQPLPAPRRGGSPGTAPTAGAGSVCTASRSAARTR
ncbi:hypothetical protein L227DRAFT_577127 [Lentinus tigrinus ALCF2SS1-6]|uniref:REJ domain-containing protein n=1 Tax=Lentinus tigrinus ALCF2SS1-6 TaxID=1328759 RepID=A0A5C2S4D1_9APHY|nr:hypothetical protein L227DRAFT_577127 [Lentinus tigrinus ALCF2SS1-6]